MPPAILPALISGALGIAGMVEGNVQQKSAMKQNENAQNQAAAKSSGAYNDAMSGLSTGYNAGKSNTNISQAPVIGQPTAQAGGNGQINTHELLSAAAANPQQAFQQFQSLPPQAQAALIAKLQQGNNTPQVG